MKSLEKYVEAQLDFISAESDFKAELCEILEIEPSNIFRISHSTYPEENLVKQVVTIQLIGINRIKSENVSKIKGLTIITPKTLEIEYSVIPL